LPLLVVDETRSGLGRLGARWRERFSLVVIAITGSNGKTTTKEILASILRAHAGDDACRWHGWQLCDAAPSRCYTGQ